jgi:adenine-specific DNA glycosylase
MIAPTEDVSWRAAVTQAILRWGPAHYQAFPWRQNDVPAWQGLVAEVLLQRTRAAQAARAFERFRCSYATPEALAEATG